ncbi:hypothetical protein AMJ86_05040 [bacterium SM23_57]|nr:MAG: hypothetical protein AMJ86_05040 [bacterium SM23_57]
MSRQFLQATAILLVIWAIIIGAYLLWSVNRTGDLAIVSNPPGARVLLNLEPTMYLTDTLIAELPEGKYSVTLEMKGYVADPFVQVVHLQRNRLSAVSFDLKPAPPPVAYSPWKSPEKTRPEYQPTFPITPRETDKTDLSDALQETLGQRPESRRTQQPPPSAPPVSESRVPGTQREYGSVEVASNIFGADIYMDGNPTGQKTNATLMVPIGIHRFAIKKENYKVQPEEVIVNVQSSETGEFLIFELIQDMESLPYRIQINTEPVAGGVLIDNIYRGEGTVNVEVDPGEYLITFQPVDGYDSPRSQKISLTPNKRIATVTGTYERRLEFSMFIDSLGYPRQSGGIYVDLGYIIPGEGFTPDTLWGPAVKYVKSMNSYAWEMGWGIATRNPTGSDYLRFRFDVPEGFTRTRPLMMRLYIFASSKNYPLTVVNKSEVDLSINGQLVWEAHTPEQHIKQGQTDFYETIALDRYLIPGDNEIVIKAAQSSQCFIYCRGIEIR